ncbi:MAG: hypothetical protein QXM16_00555 [Nitrososphaerota archaeon]
MRPEVKREIAEYCVGRWVAVHCEEQSDGTRPMIRYWSRGRPLTIGSENDVIEVLDRFSSLRPRAYYATTNIYERLKSADDLADRGNIIGAAPTWDIDSKDCDWRKVVKKAIEIIHMLEKHGVTRSVFFKWSGRGAHIHIHPKAFSSELFRKINPLDVAYSVTQYIACRIEPQEGVVVENKIDMQRVFTAPLSLHRSVDRVAVCIPPEELESFHIDWTDPNEYKHFPHAWRKYEEGEGDNIAERAYTAIGPYITGRVKRKRKHKPLDQEILDTFRRIRSWH